MFTGYIEHELIPKYISTMTVGIIPFIKTREIANNASPIKLFEYMACERTIISTPLDGVKEVVGNKILFANTENEWEEKILYLINNPNLRSQMGIQGRSFIEENFSWSAMNEKLDALIKQTAQTLKHIINNK